MNDAIRKMNEDARPIKSLHWHDAEGSCVVVGSNGVTAIRHYYENGQLAGVPWFAIYFGDEIGSRVNGMYVDSVVYESGRSETDE